MSTEEVTQIDRSPDAKSAMEKMKSQIEEIAKERANQLISEAQAKCDQILEEANKEAEATTKKLVGVPRSADGTMCPTVTRNQEATLRKMLEYLPIEEVAYQAGVDVSTLARLVAKSMPGRRRGISGAQLANAKRVNNQILNMAGKLGYNCTPKTKAQLGCK